MSSQLLIAVQAHLARFSRDTKGSYSVEFALVSLPFYTFIFLIFGFCLFLFTSYTLENSVWQAARDIRTGRYQTGQGSYANLTGKDLKAALKQSVCSRAPQFVDCDRKVRVFVQSTPNFSSITRPNCLAGDGSLVSDDVAMNGSDPGGASSVVFVTVCYSWELAKAIPFLNIGDMPDGSRLIQVSAVFRSEPYSN